MKLRLVLFAIIAFSFVVGFSACSKSPKDKVIEAYEKIYDWINSDSFDKDVLAFMEKDIENWQGSMLKKINDFALSSGFADQEDFDSTFKKNIDDPEIKEWNKKLNDAMSKKRSVIENLFNQVQQKKMQEQLQNEPTPAPTDSTVKQ